MNVQQQNFEQLEWLKWKENIKNVENEADVKLKQLEKNPEQKKSVINWIKEKLWLNKEDDSKESVETVKKNEEEKKDVIDNQGWAWLNKDVEYTPQ
jgi:hypothetical protein